MAKKKCSKCNVEFECQNETRGCWCENYVIPEKTLKELKEDFENCLCEKCLKEFADGSVKIAQ